MKRQVSGLAIALVCVIPQASAGNETDRRQTDSSEQSALILPENSQPPVKYIGNAESHKFHRPSCPFARIMAPNKRMPFFYRCQAIASGHLPCRYCLPPIWTTVRGSVLSPLNGSLRPAAQPNTPAPNVPADPP